MFYSRLSGQNWEKAWIEEKEAQHCSACLILIGGRKRDGRGTAARHGSLGCQEMAIYRRHSMAVCATISTLQGSYLSAEGRFFPLLQVCAAWAQRREASKIGALSGHLSNFPFTSGWNGDQWWQKNKVYWSHSVKNVALWQQTDHLITVAHLQFSYLVKSRKKTLNVSSLLRNLAERRPWEMCQQSKEILCRASYC